MPSITVKTTTLARVFEELDLGRLDLLKLDVEGSQQLVLEGGCELIETHQPAVIIENNVGACRRLHLEPRDAFRMLASIGYGFGTADHGAFVQPVEAPEICRSVVCLPKTSSSWSSVLA